MVTSSLNDFWPGSEPAVAGRASSPGHSKLAAHSGMLSVASGVVGVLSYGCTLLMAHVLNPGDYSQFAAAQMLLGIVGIVASALVPLPLSHVVATHPAGSEARRKGIAFALLVSMLAGTVAALLAGTVTLAFAKPSIAAVVALSALVLFVVAAPLGWLQGELRFMRYAATSIGEVLARLLFSLLAVVAFSWGTGGAILGFLVGALVLLAVPLSFYRDVTWRPQVLLHKWRWADTGDIAITLCVVSVLVGADVVVIAVLDGGSTSAAAGFQALATIAKAPVYVAAGTVLVAFPLLRTPGVPVNEVLGAALRSFGQLALVAFAVIATAPHVLMALILPERYYVALDLLPWLALAGLGYAALTVFATVLLALRANRRCQLGLVFASVAVPGGLLLGWHLDGVDGLAVGCAVGSSLAAVAFAVISFPRLPQDSGRMAVYGLAGGVGLVLVLALASQLPAVWLMVVLAVGLVVLTHQRGGIPGTAANLRFAARGIGSRLRLPAFLVGVGVDKEETLLEDGQGTSGRPAAVGPGRHRRTRRWLPSTQTSKLLAFAVVSCLAFGFRSIGLIQGFELWVDEMLYASLGLSVSAGQLPNLPDGPFFLHPPGFFLLEGAVIHLLGISGSAVDVVLELRWLNTVIGALSVGVAFLVVRKVANPAIAWGTAVVLVCEPFVLRNNSHLFLETLGMAMVLAGLLIVVTRTQRPDVKHRMLPLVCAGLLMGYGVLTKDFFAICTVAPMALAAAWRHTLRVRDSLVLIAGMVVPYAAYLLLVSAAGLFPDWLRAKTSGAQRMIGLDKSTGFTAEGSPDLISRLVDQLEHFGTSYLLLAVCPVAAAIVCFSARAERRVVGLFSLSLGVFGIYSAAFGTFEEQYGYGVIVASVLTVAVLAAEILEKRPSLRGPIISAGIALVVLTVFLGIRAETTSDSGYAQMRQWVRGNLPANARVSVTNSTGELAFADDPRFGVWPSAPLMNANGARYILTQSLPTSQGYGYAQPGMLTWLAENATPLHRIDGPTNGTTTLWVVDPAVLESAAAHGVGMPSRTYENER